MDTNQQPKNPNPLLKASFISRLFFWWLIPTFSNRKDHQLTLQNVYDIHPKNCSEILGDDLERFWKMELSESVKIRKKPNLARAIRRMFGWAYLHYAIPDIILSILRAIQPIILGLFLKHFDPAFTSTKENAYLVGTALIITVILDAIILHHSDVGRRELGLRLNVACSSLIYRKIMRLKYSTSASNISGLIINLLSNDVARFNHLFLYLHYIWILPLQVVLIAYLLWQKVGVATLVGVLLMIIQTVPIQGYLGKITSKLRKKIALRTDERVRLMGEIIRDIRNIKMYAWEKPFEHLVSSARRIEMKAIAIGSYLKGMSSAITAFTENTSIFVTIMAYVLLGNSLSAEIVYSMVQYFHIIEEVMSFYYPHAITSSAESHVSIKRIENFLLADEHSAKSPEPIRGEDSIDIKITDVSASWMTNSRPNILTNINLNITSRKLYAVVGSVGAGKSSLLNLILGELQPKLGEVHVTGSTSIACQESWLFSGTLRNNILFGQSYDEKKYNVVTEVCALWEDFSRLPQGDQTFVGDRGKSISGGQCARVNLARAAYRDADIILLDDPLSAIDPQVGKYVFHNCINGYLKNKTRILVTHQYQYLKDVDVIILLENGKIQFQGTFKEFQNLENNFLNSYMQDNINYLADPLESVDNNINCKIFRRDENKVETVDISAKGAMKSFVYKQYFAAGGSRIMLMILMLFFIFAQFLSSSSDYWVSYWVTQEEIRSQRNIDLVNASKTALKSDATALNVTLLKGLVRSRNDGDFYSIETMLYIYGTLIVSSIVMWTMNSFLFYKVCMNSSTHLHNAMFMRVLRAPMRFFDTHPAGRIHNRFTKDVGIMDENLPAVMLDAIHLFFEMAGSVIQVIIVDWRTISGIIIASILNWKIRGIYLSTAQELQRLESTAKSPVYSHVVSSLCSLQTIRASGVQKVLCEGFDSYQNVHTSVQSLLIATSSAIGFWLDLTAALFIAFLTYYFVTFQNSNTFAGSVGLALTQTLMLCGLLQYGIRQTVEIVTHLTSVERILQYTSLDQEEMFDGDVKRKPSGTWPETGAITFERLFLKYSDHQELALRNINVVIEAGMKVGIVGRTGAGKSSIISALFRLVDFEGSLSIDGIDVTTIELNDLRKNISIVPQEAMLYSASLRENLDPFRVLDDDLLWCTLEEVELKSVFDSLDYRIEGGGSNLSCGQRQLLCLARAILQDNKILVLDEATANIDTKTDGVIQAAIRKKFKEHTVLTIAHKLNTVIDNDKILVMHRGEVVEFDHPHILIRNKDGYFSKMIRQTGHEMSLYLTDAAKNAYRKQGQSQ